MNAKKLPMIAAAVFLIAACSGTAPPAPSGATANTAPGGRGPISGGSGPQTSGVSQGGRGDFIGFEGEREGDAERIREDLIVYFEFDSSEIQPRFNDMLESHGRYLASDRNLTVRLEGHADERGSREYNIGLGERRAQAVRQILMLLGVSGAQLSTVSFGEERPVAFGSDEASYSQNRRVEIVYR